MPPPVQAAVTETGRAPDLDLLVDLYPWKPTLALFRALERREVRRFAAELAEPILDLGCGDGQINRCFFDGRDSVGIDCEWRLLPYARSRMTKIVQADARHLPFPDGSYRTVFGNCSVEHMPDIDRCLAEAARVLRPDGVFLATVPSGDWKRLYAWNRFWRVLGCPRLGRAIVDAHDRRMAHLNLFPCEEWARRFEKAGLTPLACRPYLGPQGALFVTLIESVISKPFPFPGFGKESGTYYFLAGVQRRLGGERLWKPLFKRLLAPLFREAIAPGTPAAAQVIVARKADKP